MSKAALLSKIGQLVGLAHVITVEHPEYDVRRRVWNGMIDRRPTVIARPANADEVAGLIRIAADAGLALSVRGGGHSFPGFSTCDDGIVLDLSRLNSVRIDPDAHFADVGGGALLRDLDQATARFGLVTPAGLVSHTGVGGLTLGGGMGWLSRRLGLTIDNLVEVDLATADGSVSTVTPASDPELFWGLRGGGGNFGIVTRFRYRLHVLGPVTIGQWDYPVAQAAEVLNAVAIHAAIAPRSQTTAVVVTRKQLSVTAFHSGGDGLGQDSTRPFGHLAGPGDGGLAAPDYVALQSSSDAGVPWGRRYYGRGGFLASTGGQVATCVADLARSSPSADSEVYMIQLGGAVCDVAEADSAYSGRMGGFFGIVQPMWDGPEDDTRCLDWGRTGGARLLALAQAGNYVNELGDTGGDMALNAYGAAKFDRLSRLKARMDPENLFHLNQNIAPAT